MFIIYGHNFGIKYFLVARQPKQLKNVSTKMVAMVKHMLTAGFCINESEAYAFIYNIFVSTRSE